MSASASPAYGGTTGAPLSTLTSRTIFLSQVRALAMANMKSRYRKTIAGFLWVVLNPLIMFGVQSLVFQRVLKIDVPNFSLFLLTGLIPWIFIVQSLDMCTPLFVNSGRTLKAFQIHPLVYLLAQLVDNTINFLGAFLLVLVPIQLFTFVPTGAHSGGLWLLPLPVLCLFAGVLGLTWLLASVQVFFRDTRFIVPFVTSIGFYLTPVFYPKEFVPADLAWLVSINPFYRLIDPFRAALYEYTPERFIASMEGAAVTAAILLAAAALFWRRKRNEVFLHV